MSLEQSLLSLAEAIRYNADVNLQIAGLNAGKATKPAAEETEETPVKKTTRRAPAKAADPEPELDPDTREEQEPEEEQEERVPAKKAPAKAATAERAPAKKPAAKEKKPEEIRDDIRAVFEQMSELKPGSPAALLKREGYVDDNDKGRLSEVPDDELIGFLVTANKRLAQLQAEAEAEE